ncbi:MAG: ABC transporter permease [Spirochaetia bacterium]
MKLLYSFIKDIKLSAKSFYFYMEFVFALIFVAVMVFLVPKDFSTTMQIYASVDLPQSMKNMTRMMLAEDERYQLTMMDSAEAVKDQLSENRGAVGLIVQSKDGKIVFNCILQGFEGEKLKNILATTIRAGFASQVPQYQDVSEVTTLGEEHNILSDRLNILPVFLTLNAAFMGLFIIAAYVFLDKGEGTIRAFAVTPGKVWHYLAGKIGVILVTGIVSGIISAVPIAGTQANYLHLVVLIICTNLFGSALGLFIASFFDTMQKAMGWLYFAIVILAAASVSYFIPSFNPLIIRILPSYPMLFAFRETLLDNGDTGYIYTFAVIFLAAGVVIFWIADWRFKRTLTVG